MCCQDRGTLSYLGRVNASPVKKWIVFFLFRRRKTLGLQRADSRLAWSISGWIGGHGPFCDKAPKELAMARGESVAPHTPSSVLPRAELKHPFVILRHAEHLPSIWPTESDRDRRCFPFKGETKA